MMTLSPPLGLAALDLSSAEALLLALSVLVLVALAFGLRRLARLEGRLEARASAERLDEVRQLLEQAAAERGDLDQRRLERVLVDVQAGIKRLETSILGVLERQAATEVTRSSQVETQHKLPNMRERIVNRLLALGYSDIRIVSSPEELAELSTGEADGSIVVEARQGATQLKGRVLLRAGALSDVEFKSFYPTFP